PAWLLSGAAPAAQGRFDLTLANEAKTLIKPKALDNDAPHGRRGETLGDVLSQSSPELGRTRRGVEVHLSTDDVRRPPRRVRGPGPDHLDWADCCRTPRRARANGMECAAR